MERAMRRYVEDVVRGAYPQPEHTYRMRRDDVKSKS